MLKSYLLVAWRNLLRHKLFSLLNVVGLAIGMSAVLLIYFYVQSEQSYERAIPNYDRIYRVPLSYYENGKPVRGDATNCPALATALKANYPEIEESARLNNSAAFAQVTLVISANDGKRQVQFNESKLYYADASLLPLLGLTMLEGNAAQSLVEPHSLVMTKSMAAKYFGKQPALGKTVVIDSQNYLVTGVISDLPPNTHFDFEFLASYPNKDFSTNDWGWPVFYTYVRVAPGTDIAALEQKFPALIKANTGQREVELGYKTAIDLQPISEIHLESHLQAEMKPNGNARTVYLVGLLGILILVIAWINYINLSTARAMERAKEVGLRKVSGATRKQLIVQFLLDAVMLNTLGALLTITLVSALLPGFEVLTATPITTILSGSSIWRSLSFWQLPLAVFAGGIIMIGFYPALLLSSFKPLMVLKGKFSKSATGAVLRKGLVSFQYVLSMFLIAGTITIAKQINFMQSQELGFTRDQVLVIKGPSVVDSTLRTRVRYFRNEEMKLPEVTSLSKSTNVPGRVMPYANSMRLFGRSPKESVSYYTMNIDEQFFTTFEIPLIAGTSFSENDRFSFPNYPNIATLILPRDRTFHPERNKIMINERLSRSLGFNNPEDAIHQKVRFGLWAEFTGEIMGVVKNYHQQSLHLNYEPILYSYGDFDMWQCISLRLDTKDLASTIAKTQKNYAAAFPGNPFEYYFLDDYFNEQYSHEQQFKHVFTVLTVLAISVSCLGLLGLGIFNVSQRIQEIGIRKVLGAPISSILMLFCADSLKIVLWSCVIALPAVWFGAESWLSGFAFHIGLEWIIFAAPPLILLTISLVTIITVSLQAATANPVESLRME